MSDLVDRRDQRPEFFLLEVLHFIYDQGDGRVSGCSRFGQGPEQVWKIKVEISAVGGTDFGLHVEVDVELITADFDGA